MLTMGQALLRRVMLGETVSSLSRGLFSFKNIVCRRIRTWLPGLRLLHGGAGDSHPAFEKVNAGYTTVFT